MKANKLFRKLALSGVALGAAAVTLTATTFAWYTSNTEADVAAVTGATEAKGSDSIFISAAQTYTNGATTGQKATSWKDYLATAIPETTSGSIELKPVFSNSNGTLKAATTGENAQPEVKGRAYTKILEATTTGSGTEQDPYVSTANYAVEETEDILEFVLRVRSASVLASQTPLYFSAFNLTSAASTSGADVSQIPLATGGNTGISDKNAYSASLVKALKLDITSAPVVPGANNVIPETAATGRLSTDNNSVSTYAFHEFGTKSDNLNPTAEANAIGYYNTVMGTHYALSGPATGYVPGTETYVKDPTDASAINGYTAVPVANLPATQGDDSETTDVNEARDFSVVEIRFVVYLDGWDQYCYDIMQGQTVTFSFELTTSANKAVLYTKN